MSGSLSHKYNITLDQLSFEFIEKCEDRKVLECIFRILKSGEEGCFRDLEKAAENRLAKIHPKSSILRKNNDLVRKSGLSDSMWRQLESELEDWEEDVKCQELCYEKLAKLSISKETPGIRKIAGIETSEKETKSTSKSNREKTDWDKFDVTEEVMKLDIEEEQKQELEKKMELERQKEEKEFCNLETLSIQKDAPVEAKLLLAEKAKDKGNEYFKAGDMKMAINYYNESMLQNPTCTAACNRAMAFLKMGQFLEAKSDCDYVLAIEPENVKALYRRARALSSLSHPEHWKAALKDLEQVLVLDPNNKAAQKDILPLKQKLGLISQNKVRVEIKEELSGLPMTFYGPSTSNLRVDPQAMLMSLYGTVNSRGLVPCRCNGIFRTRHPMCRLCGEKEMKMLLQKSGKVCASTEDEWTASKIYDYCYRNNTNFFIKPTKKKVVVPKKETANEHSVKSMKTESPDVVENHLTKVVSSEKINKTRITNIEPFESVVPCEKTNNLDNGDERLEKKVIMEKDTTAIKININSPIKSQREIRMDPVKENCVQKVEDSPSLTSTPVPNEKMLDNSCGGKSSEKNNYFNCKGCRACARAKLATQDIGTKQGVLAWQARERGDACFSTDDYKTALAYYTTSYRLCPDPDTKICRATAYIKLQRFEEAASECTDVLKADPYNIQALLCRATAYSGFGDCQQCRLGVEDVERAMSWHKADCMKEELNKLKTFLLKRIELFSKKSKEPAPAAANSQVTGSRSEKQKSSSSKRKNRRKKSEEVEKPPSFGKIEKMSDKELAEMLYTSYSMGRESRLKELRKMNKNATVEPVPDLDEKISRVMKKYRDAEKEGSYPFFGNAPVPSVAPLSNGFAHKNNESGDIDMTSPTGASVTKLAVPNGCANQVQNILSAESSAVNHTQSQIPSSFQFYSRWESARKSDSSWLERIKILSSVPPRILPSVVGEKLDADMVNDMVRCLDVIGTAEPNLSAEYLSQLPLLPRFSLVKLLLDGQDIEHMKRLVTTLEQNGVQLANEVKTALL